LASPLAMVRCRPAPRELHLASPLAMVRCRPAPRELHCAAINVHGLIMWALQGSVLRIVRGPLETRTWAPTSRASVDHTTMTIHPHARGTWVCLMNKPSGEQAHSDRSGIGQQQSTAAKDRARRRRLHSRTRAHLRACAPPCGCLVAKEASPTAWSLFASKI